MVGLRGHIVSVYLFTYAYIIYFFILFVNPFSHLAFHTLIFSFISTGGEKFFSPPVPFLKSNNTTFNFEYPKNSYTYHNCTYHSKNRRCDTTALVRNIPETFLRDWDIIPTNCLLSPKGDACWYNSYQLFIYVYDVI